MWGERGEGRGGPGSENDGEGGEGRERESDDGADGLWIAVLAADAVAANPARARPFSLLLFYTYTPQEIRGRAGDDDEGPNE